MKDSTLIADLVRAGVSPELVQRVVCEITAQMSGTNVRDNVREYERVRKRNQRKTGGKQTMSAAQVAENVPDNVPDNGKSLSLTSLPSSDSLLEKQQAEEVVVARREKVKRGSRLPPDWVPGPEEKQFARELGASTADIERMASEFRDFWIGIPGSRGLKLNWPATWRNRVRDVMGKSKGHVNGKRTIMEAADDLVDRIRAFNDPAPGSASVRGGAGEAPARLLPKG